MAQWVGDESQGGKKGRRRNAEDIKERKKERKSLFVTYISRLPANLYLPRNSITDGETIGWKERTDGRTNSSMIVASFKGKTKRKKKRKG